MADFMRTTGGLLQLKSKQSVRVNYDRVVEFAKSVGVNVAAAQASGQGGATAAQSAKPAENQPMDLQTNTPEVFR